MENYNPQEIEPKWQRYWEKKKLFQARDFSKKPKLYLLVEFPYPSAEGLHVGHCRSYTAMDVIARKKRMEGFNVLFPMGWDAFGLPTENYAIKTGIHPKIVTAKNTANFKRQSKSLGFSFDWSREINTSDPRYYKWTQWIFLKFFEKGLAYKRKMPVNWCPSCKIVLANEEVIDGACERCGAKVERREKEQWLLKITKYAERLLRDLDKVDYPEKVKILQRDWIGKSEGVEINFPVSNSRLEIPVFTTRLDTIFGATYLVLAPEHPILEKLEIRNWEAVKEYIEKSKEKAERERISEEKSGIKLEGPTAINPFNQKEIPIFVADYVLMSYATGAIMAVPAHDRRDYLFAKNYNLPIIEVIKQKDTPRAELPFTEDGILASSGKFSGLKSAEAREKMTEWLIKEKKGKRKVYYKLRDWIFSRQHYWGEPIPLVFCKSCQKRVENLKSQKISNPNLKKEFSEGELLNPGWIALSEKDLPLKLPELKDFKPTESGESLLAKNKRWINTKCPKCGGGARRETDTMPNWAGSNWYFLRYCDPKNRKTFASRKLLEYWMPVDWYNGGMEHTTLHLLYSRFCYKVLSDLGLVPFSEPYKKRTSHGVILSEGGVKMSKSKGNVIAPDEVVKNEGADTLRVYEMFIGPFTQAVSWNKKGVEGVRRFLRRIWKLFEKSQSQIQNSKNLKLKRELHKTIKKVSEDIENLKFNTAVSAMMEFSNLWEKNITGLEKKERENFLKILSPFAPHLAEELWQRTGKKRSIFLEPWPKYDKKLIKGGKFLLIIQVNGKVRDKIETDIGIEEKEAEKIALGSEKIKKWLEGKKIKKIIFVPNKLINFVT